MFVVALLFLIYFIRAHRQRVAFSVVHLRNKVMNISKNTQRRAKERSTFYFTIQRKPGASVQTENSQEENAPCVIHFLLPPHKPPQLLHTGLQCGLTLSHRLKCRCSAISWLASIFGVFLASFYRLDVLAIRLMQCCEFANVSSQPIQRGWLEECGTFELFVLMIERMQIC